MPSIPCPSPGCDLVLNSDKQLNQHLLNKHPTFSSSPSSSTTYGYVPPSIVSNTNSPTPLLSNTNSPTPLPHSKCEVCGKEFRCSSVPPSHFESKDHQKALNPTSIPHASSSSSSPSSFSSIRGVSRVQSLLYPNNRFPFCFPPTPSPSTSTFTSSSPSSGSCPKVDFHIDHNTGIFTAISSSSSSSHLKKDIVQLINDHSLVLITGATGSGKSTRIPVSIIESSGGWNKSQNRILSVQPRRLAATLLADFVADHNSPHVAIGREVGWKLGFTEPRCSPETKLLFVTFGIFFEELIHLKRRKTTTRSGTSTSTGASVLELPYTHVILDEIHERSVDVDMCLTLMKLLLQQQQELQRASLNSTTPPLPFKLVLMSATMDVPKFTDYFSSLNSFGVLPLKALHINISRDAPHPVTVHFDHSSVPHFIPDLLPSPMTLKTVILKNMAMQIQNFHFRNPYTEGILAFVPGIADIQRLLELLSQLSDIRLIPLHSRLPFHPARADISTPLGQRNVYIATNIAESSITLPEVSLIVDSCTVKETGILETWISRASMDQRKGRTGRTKPGTYIACIPEALIRDFSNPEIKQLSLEVLVLKFMQLSAQWGQATDVLTSCLDPPDQKNIDSAYRTLAEYGLIDEIQPVHLGGVPNQTNSSLTIRGFVAANLPCSFENSVLILNGWLFGCLREAVVASVIAENGSPFKRRTSKEEHLQITLNRWNLFQELFPEAPIPESDTIIDLCVYLHWAKAESSSPSSIPVELDEETLKEIREKENILLQRLSDSAGIIDQRPLSAILHSLSQPGSTQLLVFEAILVMSWIKNTSVANAPAASLGTGLASVSNSLGRIDLISVKRIGMSLESGPSLALRSTFLEKGVVSNSGDLHIVTSGKNIEIYFTSPTGCPNKEIKLALKFASGKPPHKVVPSDPTLGSLEVHQVFHPHHVSKLELVFNLKYRKAKLTKESVCYPVLIEPGGFEEHYFVIGTLFPSHGHLAKFGQITRVRDDLLPLVFLLWVVGYPTALFRELSQGHYEFVVDLAGRRKALSIVLSPGDFEMIVDLKRAISSQLQSLKSDLVRRERVGGRAAEEVSVSKGDSGISLHLKLLNLITRFSGQQVWREGLKVARDAKLAEEGLSRRGPSISFSEVFKESISGNIWTQQ